VAQAVDRRGEVAGSLAIIATTWQTLDGEPAVVPSKPQSPKEAPVSPLQQTSARVNEQPSSETLVHPIILAASSHTLNTDPPAEAAPSGSEPLPTPRLVPLPDHAAPALAPPIAHPHYRYPSGTHGHGELPPVPPDVPREFEKQALPPYIVEPPDILLINASNAITLPTQPLVGQHLVRMDGTINLGIYGSVFVAGLTLDQIQDVVANVLKARRPKRRGDDGKATGEEMTVEQIKLELQVDVLAYNSKVYYIITDGGGYGEQVYRISATGNETVLDALSQINGLPAVASKKKIWVARATPDHSPPKILPVDWCGIVKDGSAATNYQIFPGDRIYVNSDSRIRTDSALGKFLAPVERVLGTVLLGSSTVNSIRNGGNTGNTTTGR
jgi:polysaccharide export outer membrane protein